MVKTDGCKYGNQCILNNIGGIQSAAHTGFQYNNVTVLFLKIKKSKRCLYFKGCRLTVSFCLQLLTCFLQPCHIQTQILFADRPLPYLEPLSVVKDRW